MIKRELVLNMLNSAIASCEQRGGAIALIGPPGSGKSGAIQQLAESMDGSVTIHVPKHEQGQAVYEPLPTLSGLCVLDDAWCFPNVAAALRQHVEERGQTAVIVCNDETEAAALCDLKLVSIVPVSNWQVLNSATIQKNSLGKAKILSQGVASIWLDAMVHSLQQSGTRVWIVGTARAGKTSLGEAIFSACGAQGFKPEILELATLPDVVPDDVYLIAFRQNSIDLAWKLSDLFGGEVTPDELLLLPQWQVCYRADEAIDGTPGERGYVNVQPVLLH